LFTLNRICRKGSLTMMLGTSIEVVAAGGLGATLGNSKRTDVLYYKMTYKTRFL
jgi:hypothetical protein